MQQVGTDRWHPVDCRPSPFPIRPGQGVNCAPGVWHHPLLALNEIGDFFVVDRSGPGNNCDEVSIEPPVSLSLD